MARIIFNAILLIGIMFFVSCSNTAKEEQKLLGQWRGDDDGKFSNLVLEFQPEGKVKATYKFGWKPDEIIDGSYDIDFSDQPATMILRLSKDDKSAYRTMIFEFIDDDSFRFQGSNNPKQKPEKFSDDAAVFNRYTDE